jgi:hypothetical protein
MAPHVEHFPGNVQTKPSASMENLFIIEFIVEFNQQSRILVLKIDYS